jgi:periplasmic divalent cation tolerance protein
MSDDAEYADHLAALRETFRSRLPDYHASFVKARSSFLTSGEEGLSELRRLAHTIAGAAGTFGFPEISETALEVEVACDAALAGEEPREAATGPLRQLIREIELSL